MIINFKHEKISEHITRIDTINSYCYLVEGTEQACLIDTGWGVGDLKSYVDSITDKPYFVIISHCHIDHVNGAGLFDRVYMNRKDWDMYPGEYDPDRRMKHLKDMEDYFPELKSLTKADFNCYLTKPFFELNDGDEFDLGGVTVKAINVQGHTPGMTTVLIKEDRIMFYGDSCSRHTYLFDKGSMKISEYLEGLKHLKEYDDCYDTVLKNHNAYIASKSILDDNIRLCQLVLEHKDAHQSVVTQGYHVFAAVEVEDPTRPIATPYSNLLYLDKNAE